MWHRSLPFCIEIQRMITELVSDFATNKREKMREVQISGHRRKISPSEEMSSMGSDRLFAEKRMQVDDFTFDRETARVFDDMLSRSVPFYTEIQRMIAEIASDFAVDSTNIYDLGCSL